MSDPFRRNLAVLEDRARDLEAENATVRSEIARIRAASKVPAPTPHPLRGPLVTFVAVFVVHALFWGLRGKLVSQETAPHVAMGVQGAP